MVVVDSCDKFGHARCVQMCPFLLVTIFPASPSSPLPRSLHPTSLLLPPLAIPSPSPSEAEITRFHVHETKATDGPTDGGTDRPFYKDAGTHLK